MDIQHHFIEAGQGEPLILLHGNGEDSSYFGGQIDVFARYYRVYALDTRGHGKTPRGEAPFTIRQFAEDLLGFRLRDGAPEIHPVLLDWSARWKGREIRVEQGAVTEDGTAE